MASESTEAASTDSARRLSGRWLRAASLSWIAALLAGALLLALSGYRTKDPDSRVYAGIAARLATEPVSRWIAPEWWGLWNFTGPFREHPIGIFVLPALTGAAGYPPEQAAFAWNGVYQAASLGLASLLAATLVPGREARALAWMLQLLPIAFVFRIRANQEYAVLAGVLLALYATERSRRAPAWGLVTAAALAWVLLVKGVFGLMVPALCALWLATRDAFERPPHRLRPYLLLAAITVVVLPAVTIGYEALYRQATGDSFLAFYTGPRLDPERVAAGALERVAYQTAWYAGRLVWYASPLSVIGIAAAAACWRRGRQWPSAERAGTLFVTMASAMIVVAFAFSDRKADRFVFPAYFFIAALGGVAAARRWPRAGAVVARLDKPWVPAAVWLALFLLRLLSGQQLPRWTFWRS